MQHSQSLVTILINIGPAPAPLSKHRWRELSEQFEPDIRDMRCVFGFGRSDIVEIAPLVLCAAVVRAREK